MRNDVGQPLHLSFLLVTHEDGLIAARKDHVSPSDRASDLARELRVEIVHETGQPLAVLSSREEMKVVRGKD